MCKAEVGALCSPAVFRRQQTSSEANKAGEERLGERCELRMITRGFIDLFILSTKNCAQNLVGL